MKLLLDTCSFLWAVREPERLSQPALEAFQDPSNEVWLSVVSTWEIAMKHSLGRLPLPDAPERFVPNLRDRHGIEALILDESAVWMLPRLPKLHRDPFDRMLACQALVEGLVLVTPDANLTRYPVRTLW